MSSRELSEWIAYDRVEPIGAFRSDLAAGMIAATIASVHHPKGSYSPADFMPIFGEPRGRRESSAAMAAKAKSITAVLGGTIKTR